MLLQGWARNGLTDEQIASNMGISTCTLYDWKKKYTDIAKALKKGKEVVDLAVENALLKKALAGDTTAMIFWLKNRRPDRWRDRHENTVDFKKSQEDATAETLAILGELIDENQRGEKGHPPQGASVAD
jgi:hypothetical protein